MATISIAAEDQEVVADQFTAAVGEERRTAGETCEVLLALAGRGASESEAVRKHPQNDCGASVARRLSTKTEETFAVPRWSRRISVTGEQAEGGKQTTEAAGRAERAAPPPQR